MRWLIFTIFLTIINLILSKNFLIPVFNEEKQNLIQKLLNILAVLIWILLPTAILFVLKKEFEL